MKFKQALVAIVFMLMPFAVGAQPGSPGAAAQKAEIVVVYWSSAD